MADSDLPAASRSDPKTLLMHQVRQEAAMNNARQLIEVLIPIAIQHSNSG